jgi:hypothetical protein
MLAVKCIKLLQSFINGYDVGGWGLKEYVPIMVWSYDLVGNGWQMYRSKMFKINLALCVAWAITTFS